MGIIKTLPPALQHKIAAGEVIERPASILKELIENSIDAGAKHIGIELWGGGIDRLVVSDDGSGMNAEDAGVAFERYTTSKLFEEAELFKIGTLGFRGEALSSIAAVCRVELITKQAEDSVATQMIVEGGQCLESGHVAASDGTTITVSKLFFNTPVRRKYLKSVTTENHHCLQVVEDQALIHSEIGFVLTSNGKRLYDLPPAEWATRVAQVIGAEVSEGVLPLNHPALPYHITGFIGLPGKAKASRKHQYLYVNGRRMNDYLISYRAKDAYSTLLDKQQHPLLVLNIQMPPELVDVNVHPRKAEVKFQDSGVVYKSIQEAVVLTLQKNDLVPRPRLEVAESFGGFDSARPGERPLPTFGEADQTRWAMREERPRYGMGSVSPFPKGDQGEFPTPLQQRGEMAMTPVAQLYATYLLAERGGESYLIDQHAAQERTMYERLMARHAGRGVRAVQALLVPLDVEFSALESSVLEPALPFLHTLGIEMGPFGENTFVIRAVPVELAQANMRGLLQAVIDQLREEKAPKAIDEQIEKRLIMRACKISIKANERLDQAQQQKVIDDLLACETPYTCPHGRPTMIKLEERELERLFGRR